MATQQSLDQAYMNCALAISQLSKAERKKVGAILVSATGHHIIAEGYNGTPSGFDNVCESIKWCINGELNNVFELEDVKTFAIEQSDGTYITERGNRVIPVSVTKPEVLHAESNVISKIARSTNTSDGSTLYITMSPCFDCAKLIIQAGIKRVVYLEEYRILDGIALLNKANIEVTKL